MIDDIARLRVAPSSTVRDAVEALAANGRQIVLVLDEQDRLHGVVTDGDVRRGLLRGVSLDSGVGEVLNADPVVAPRGTADRALVELMERLAIRHVPLEDDGRIVGVFTVDDVIYARSTPSRSSVVLMAGGRGERLRPLTEKVPKPMLPIAGVPMIEIILRNLAEQGFRKVSISVNYLADVIIDHVGDGSQLGLTVDYLREDKPLGTAGALAGLDARLDQPLIVMNSDLLTQVNLVKLLESHAKAGSRVTMGVREHLVPIPFGVVTVEGSRVTSIVEKPDHRSLVNAGIYALDPSVLGMLTPGEYADMPGLIELVMKDGGRVGAFPIHETWVDVGRPEDLDMVRRDSDRWAR